MTAQHLTETTATGVRMLTQYGVHYGSKPVWDRPMSSNPTTNGRRYTVIRIDDNNTVDCFYAAFDLTTEN